MCDQEITITKMPAPEQVRLACIINSEEVGSCICTIYNNSLALSMIVDNLKVNENERKGYGLLLLYKAFNLAKEKGVDCIELWVRADNHYIKKLYALMNIEKIDKEHWRKILNVK
jgi:hypothetical protein